VLNTEFGIGDKPRRLCIKVPKKEKVKKGQIVLFHLPDPYPTEFTLANPNQEEEKWMRKLTDISIVDDMLLPAWFYQHIDWDRIKKRLEGKVNKLLDIHFKVINNVQTKE
jgi:hypothetical protein